MSSDYLSAWSTGREDDSSEAITVEVELQVPLPHTPNQNLPSDLGNDITEVEFLQRVTLYQAGLTGDWETVELIRMSFPYCLSARITKGGDTVLHIASAAKQTHLVQKLVGRMDPPALALANKLGNTALCFAAVSGVVKIAQVMVMKNKELPNIRGSQGITPLHMAVLLGHVDMVEYLLTVTDDARLTDLDRICLLTSSIDTNLFEVASTFLKKRPYLALLRDAKRETALHALARKPLNPGGNQSSLCQKYKMQRGNSVTNHREPKTALDLVQSLWNEVIKKKDNDISHLIGYPWRLLFVTAKLGKVNFLTVLIRSYPDIIWKVDENRCSIFHIAVIHRHEEIFKLIYEIGAIKDLIATYKDGHGNNMLHLASKLAPPNRLNSISGAALQMQHEILWYEAVERVIRPEYTEAENEDGKTPHTLFSEEHEGLRTKGEEWMKKTAESCTLVAALIATVVFSAAFQLPGGVNSEGSPNLVARATFKFFALSNAASLFTSTASILMFLSILTSRYAERDFRRSLPSKLMMGLILLLISMATMISAFTATFIITFQNNGMKWVPIPTALIAFFPITLFAAQQFRLLLDIYHSTYKSQSMFLFNNQQNLFQHPQDHGSSSNERANSTASTSYNQNVVIHNHGERAIIGNRPSPCFFSFSRPPSASMITNPVSSQDEEQPRSGKSQHSAGEDLLLGFEIKPMENIWEKFTAT